MLKNFKDTFYFLFICSVVAASFFSFVYLAFFDPSLFGLLTLKDHLSNFLVAVVPMIILSFVLYMFARDISNFVPVRQDLENDSNRAWAAFIPPPLLIFGLVSFVFFSAMKGWVFIIWHALEKYALPYLETAAMKLSYKLLLCLFAMSAIGAVSLAEKVYASKSNNVFLEIESKKIEGRLVLLTEHFLVLLNKKQETDIYKMEEVNKLSIKNTLNLKEVGDQNLSNYFKYVYLNITSFLLPNKASGSPTDKGK